MSNDLQVCPVCHISITSDVQVNFSSGTPVSRSRLYARVCQYTDSKACINQDAELVGKVSLADRFEDGKNLVLNLDQSNHSAWDRSSKHLSIFSIRDRYPYSVTSSIHL